MLGWAGHCCRCIGTVGGLKRIGELLGGIRIIRTGMKYWIRSDALQSLLEDARSYASWSWRFFMLILLVNMKSIVQDATVESDEFEDALDRARR